MEREKILTTVKKMAAAGAAALILFAGGAFGSYFATHQAASMSNSHTEPSAAVSSVSSAYAQDVYTGNPIVKIVKNSSPAVVNIDTETMVRTGVFRRQSRESGPKPG